MTEPQKRILLLAMPWLAMGGLLLAWEIACIVFDVPEILAPRPSRIIETIRGIGYVIRDKTRKE